MFNEKTITNSLYLYTDYNKLKKEKMSVIPASDPERWRTTEEMQKGSRRGWFTGTEERKIRPWYERWSGAILRAGAIPKHVAFIMDGNRRFAKEKQVTRAAGHLAGFEKLATVLESCLDMGITEVSVYAFSIENFKRSPDEVQCLMDLCREKFQVLLEGRQQELLMEYGVCVRIVGEVSLLPQDLQQMLAKVVVNTCNNSKAYLNVCLAYTSRHDMASAVRACAQAVAQQRLLPEDVSADVITSALQTAQAQEVDMLLRTSGEVRLSDFLLWESSHSCLVFEQVLWPNFSIWDLYKAILMFQRYHPALSRAKEESLRLAEEMEQTSDQQQVLQQFYENLPPEGADIETRPTEEVLQKLVDKYREKRKTRISNFIKDLQEERLKEFQRLASMGQ